MTISLGRWSIGEDRSGTAGVYALLPEGTGCNCCWCRNFMAAIGTALPPEFIAIADLLGIDPRKPAEIADYGIDEDGRHLTGGWYHFIGEMADGRDASRPEGENAWTLDLESLASGFEIGFTNRLACLSAGFKRPGVIQLEFHTHVPWVLPEPDPT